MASKYAALADHLRRQSGSRCTMSFTEIEDIVGEKLPKSARIYKPWWSNHYSHSQAEQGWLASGWQVTMVELDLIQETVTFRR
jgi:hypothetical protein